MQNFRAQKPQTAPSLRISGYAPALEAPLLPLPFLYAIFPGFPYLNPALFLLKASMKGNQYSLMANFTL